MPFPIKGSRSIAGLLVLLFWIALNAVDLESVRAGTALGDLAASMQAGQWVQLKTNNANVVVKANGGDILEYSNRGAWDPVGRRAYFCGASHHGSFFNDCVQYDEATNSWSSIGVPPGACKDNCLPDTVLNLVHGYDHNAFDTSWRIFYPRAGRDIFAVNAIDSTWSKIAAAPADCLYSAAIAEVIEYFPDMDRLVFLNPYCSPGGAAYYNPVTNTWSSPAAALPNGGYHLEGAYSKDGYLYGGCGNSASTSLSRVDKNGNWQAMAATPVSCAIIASLLVGDPASGRILLFGSSIYELNPQSNTWTNTGVTSQFTPGVSAIVVPISNHGVVMLVKTVASQTATEVWLYKHTVSSSTPIITDTTPPSIPANVSALPASSSQTNISWSPSTDNVGVASYLLERCLGSACTNFAQIAASTSVSYSDMGLAVNTVYRYRVRAR